MKTSAATDGRPSVIHAGHRARLRSRFRAEGLEAFEDHQVLELLLFHAVPRRDTNPTAHLLLQRYGSLAAVLDADPLDLARTNGIGEGAATLLSLVPQLTARYLADRHRRKYTRLTTSEAAAALLSSLLAGRTEEAFFAVCLDTQCRVIVPALVAEGTVDHATVEPRKVVEAALRHKAHSVILGHNHPAGTARPSTADHQATSRLVAALAAVGVPVRDHLIVAGNEWFSFARAGDLPGQSS